jgi:hypothetical protein
MPNGLKNIPNSHLIHQYFTLEGHPKYTQIGIFGMKINHLATLQGSLWSAYVSYSCEDKK